MTYFGRRHAVSGARFPPLFLRIAAVMLLAVLAGGCYERLAQKDAFFHSRAKPAPTSAPRPSAS